MKALLCSWAGAINTPQIFETHFDSKFRKMRVAYVPNAKDDLDDTEREKKITESIQKFSQQVKSVTKFDLYQEEDNFSTKYIESNFDVIYVSGGLVAPLLKAFTETGFDQLLQDLQHTEVKYLGSSAGSMVASVSQKVATWYPGEEEPAAIELSGLGWLPFEIFPHFNSLTHHQIVQKHTQSSGRPIIVLPDNSAVGLDNGELHFYNQARLLL